MRCEKCGHENKTGKFVKVSVSELTQDDIGQPLRSHGKQGFLTDFGIEEGSPISSVNGVPYVSIDYNLTGWAALTEPGSGRHYIRRDEKVEIKR